jgi:NAD(P)-dependent dehydrogenase (short-subunit alcohol dehydrogenase family)
MSDLKNKVVIVSGGAEHLGSAFSAAIAQTNGNVVVADIDLPKATGVAKEINKSAGREAAIACTLDVTNDNSIEETICTALNWSRRLEAVVNSAYPRTSSWGKHFFDVTYKEFCENLDLQLGGSFLISQRMAAFFAEQGRGNIINIASVSGVMAPRFETYEGTSMTTPVAYSAIKAGIIHLTRYMTKYVGGKNVRFNCVSPGGILDKQPESFLRRYKSYCANKGMLDASDVVGAVLFLLSDDSEYVNGQNIVVDDGFSIG